MNGICKALGVVGIMLLGFFLFYALWRSACKHDREGPR
jgi:hypothetical protein